MHPVQNYSRVEFYRVYSSYTGVHIVDRNTTTYTEHLNGTWSGVTYRVAAVNANDEELYGGPAYLSGPMCEGSSCPVCPFTILAIVVLAIVLVAVVVLVRRRHD
ncbi:MAG: hypothetical protein LUO79_02715 [Methanomassiliicoccales archaeon]|nr:hypothetical protein [Methanomassiliicoccales archaeon]